MSATKARRTVPLNVDAALRKALEKLPADRFARELFFVDAANNVVAAQVDGSAGFRVLGREILFSVAQGYGIGAGNAFIDVTADGERFLMARPAGLTSSETGDDDGPGFVLVQNFFAELRRLAPN